MNKISRLWRDPYKSNCCGTNASRHHSFLEQAHPSLASIRTYRSSEQVKDSTKRALTVVFKLVCLLDESSGVGVFGDLIYEFLDALTELRSLIVIMTKPQFNAVVGYWTIFLALSMATTSSGE